MKSPTEALVVGNLTATGGRGMTDKLLKFGNVVAHGLDVVDLADFSRLMNTQASGFLDRYFTPSELATANKGGNRIERLASRFAIKEAVMKALGTGWGDGIAFTDVEAVSLRKGAPTVVLHRRLAAIADEHGVVRWMVSASHTATVAIASVIALGVIGAPHRDTYASLLSTPDLR